MIQPPNSDSTAPSSSASSESAEVNASPATTLEAFVQIASRNPRFKMRKPSGNAYVICGARPSGTTR